jgi:hypothetical protein
MFKKKKYRRRVWLRPLNTDDGFHSSLQIDFSAEGGTISMTDCSSRRSTLEFYAYEDATKKAKHVKVLKTLAKEFANAAQKYEEIVKDE